MDGSLTRNVRGGDRRGAERFRQGLEDAERRQAEALSGIGGRNALFLDVFEFEAKGSVYQGTGTCPAVPGLRVSQVSLDPQEPDGRDQGVVRRTHKTEADPWANNSPITTLERL